MDLFHCQRRRLLWRGFLDPAHKLYTNSTIDYNFLDYWDIPADETVLNPPGAGSAAVINPNF